MSKLTWKFQPKQRVFDTECGKFATVLYHLSPKIVAIQYDDEPPSDDIVETADVANLQALKA